MSRLVLSHNLITYLLHKKIHTSAKTTRIVSTLAHFSAPRPIAKFIGHVATHHM